MAEKNQTETLPELKFSKPAPKEPKAARLLPKRKFEFDKDELAAFLNQRLLRDMDDREERIQRRMARMDKLFGWLPDKNYPWPNCANFWVPVMRIADLKLRGALENAIKAVRPLMSAKAAQKRNAGKTKKIDQLLDYQFFIENDGERFIDNLVAHFCQDETAYVTVRQVVEEQTFHDIRIFPPLAEDKSLDVQILEMIRQIYEDGKRQSERMTDEKGYEWEIVYIDDISNKPRIAKVCFYQKDDGGQGNVCATIVSKATTFNGPAVRVENFEDIVYPVRSANLQAPVDSNPDGAPYYFRLFNASLDTIRRRMEDGMYNQLDDDDIEEIEAGKSGAGRGEQDDEPKEQKDKYEGSEVTLSNSRDDRPCAEFVGRWDVDGDGLEEDIIVWFERSAKKILGVALLTEFYPGLPIRRPIEHDSFIPTPNRIIGQSQCEILESLQDCMQTMLDMHVDNGEITNTPMGFYRAASGLKGEPMAIEPGQMFPLDDPLRDIVFPQWPTKDSGFALNTMAVLQQFVDRIQAASAVAYGQVPTGKASALRTVGTTMALMQPTDERSEMILRRMFGLLAGVFQLMHRLNRRYLPREKEIRVAGMSEAGQDAYQTINPNDIDATIDFEFQGSMINANKQMLKQELNEVGMIVASPLAMALGLVTPQKWEAWARDMVTACNQDPDKYLERIPSIMSGPKLTAEEVVSAILANDLTLMNMVGAPLENPQEHLMKLQAYTQSPAFGFMNVPQVQVLKVWIMRVQMLLQQMMIMQGATQQEQPGQGGQNNQNGQQGGKPTTVSDQGTGLASNAPVGSGELIDESIGMNGGA